MTVDPLASTRNLILTSICLPVSCFLLEVSHWTSSPQSNLSWNCPAVLEFYVLVDFPNSVTFLHRTAPFPECRLKRLPRFPPRRPQSIVIDLHHDNAVQ